MQGWGDLERELDRWHEAGERATFWWRDDAEAPTAALDRKLALARRHSVPLHIAVVPARAGSAIAERCRGEPDLHVMQHGFAHRNHEPDAAPAAEFGRNRRIESQLDDLREGWRRLAAAGMPNLLPAFVPPWNRIAPATMNRLGGLGYRAISASRGRSNSAPVPGLARVDVQCDPIRWKSGARFRGTARTVSSLVEHLTARRLEELGKREPTGVSTHHLQADEEVWDFCDELAARLTRHPAGAGGRSRPWAMPRWRTGA